MKIEKLKKNKKKTKKKTKQEEESQFIYTTIQEMLYESMCLGHQKWHQMHYHANALIKWHFGYESNARCNDWIPKSNPFRRFLHKKVALFLHKKLQRTKKSPFLYKSYQSYLLKILEFQ